MSEWQEFELGEVGFFTNGVNKSKGSFGYGYPFVNLLDIFDKDRIYTIPHGLVDVNQDELTRYNLVEGDILFVRSSVKLEGVGKVCVVTKDLKDTIYSGFIIRFRQSETILDKYFSSYYLNSSPIRNQIISKGTLSANSNINQESLKTIRIKIPSIAQQRRIAQILSTCDAVIEKTQIAIEKYKAIKQGMLHDLFTRGIDITTGKLRPKYEEAPELYKESKLGWVPQAWDVEELIKYLSFISYGFTNPMPETNDGPFLITAANVNDGRIQYETCRKTSKDAYDNLLTEKSKPHINDILLTKDGTLGRIAIVEKENICINQSVAVLRPNKLINPLFLKILLESPYYQKNMIDEAGGSTIKHIYITKVDKMPIAVPRILKEQEMIIERLLTINYKLQTGQNYLLKLQQIKAGLMSDLLSGKKRVPVPDEALATAN